MGASGARPHAGAPLALDRLVAAALAEDLGDRGDITSEAILPADLMATAALRSRADGVLAGRAAAASVPFLSRQSTAGPDRAVRRGWLWRRR